MDELKTTDNVESQLTPQQYFEQVKERKHNITDEELDDFGIVDPVSREIVKYRYAHSPKGFYPNPWVALQ